MKVKMALDIGRDCGLTTVGEAIFNIEIHSMSLFDYGSTASELNELHNDWSSLKDKHNYTEESNIEEVLNNLD